MQPSFEDDFSLELPVWTLVNGKVHEALGFPESIYLPPYPDAGRVLPIFTDEDLASRHLQETKRPNIATAAIETSEQLFAIIEEVKHDGISDAGIDMPAPWSQRIDSGWIVGVNELWRIYKRQNP